jgi:hypothetical protein
MMMSSVNMVVKVTLATGAAGAAVSTAFGLEGGLHFSEIRSQSKEHILDHMIGPNAKNLVSDLGRQMPISQMPGKAHKLIRVSMPDFDDKFCRGLNPEPSPILKLQAISIGHRDRFRQVEKDVFTLIRCQANATAMARVKIESDRARRFFLRPKSGGSMSVSAMNGGAMRSHNQYMK